MKLVLKQLSNNFTLCCNESDVLLASGFVGNTGIVYITHKLFQDISQLMSSLSQA